MPYTRRAPAAPLFQCERVMDLKDSWPACNDPEQAAVHDLTIGAEFGVDLSWSCPRALNREV